MNINIPERQDSTDFIVTRVDETNLNHKELKKTLLTFIVQKLGLKSVRAWALDINNCNSYCYWVQACTAHHMIGQKI